MKGRAARRERVNPAAVRHRDPHRPDFNELLDEPRQSDIIRRRAGGQTEPDGFSELFKVLQSSLE